MRKLFFLIFGFIGLISLVSCEKEVDEREKDELMRLQAYMSLNYPNLQPTESGLYYIIYEQGDGEALDTGKYFLYYYTGMNLNEVVFDTNVESVAVLNDTYSKSTHYVPAFAEYNESLLKGMKEGLSYLKPPAKARFIMPSKLAYGASMKGTLYPYSSVIYDVELIDVIPDPKVYEQQIIDDYIADYLPFGILDTILYDGVYFLNKDEGIGEFFEDNDYVTVNYIGSFTDGFIFDTNIESVATENGIYNADKTYLPLDVLIGQNSEAIDGFSVVLKKLRRKGYAKVLITSEKAYGVVGTTNIRPYEPLIFEIFVQTDVDNPDDDSKDE